MKTNFKKTLTIGLGVIIITGILVPSLILAQTENDASKVKGLCERLSTAASKIDQKIVDRNAKLEAKRIDILDKINTRRNKRDTKIAEKRARWDTNRAEHFAKLEIRVQTDEQKQAVITFTETVQTAIAARRAAIDTAIQDFRQGVDEAISARKTSIDAIINDFRNSINSAVEKAKSDCEAGVDPKTVRENLRADLKTARENFVNEKQEIEKLRTEMELLVTARKEAISQAIEDFKTVITQARDDLKTAFPKEQESE